MLDVDASEARSDVDVVDDVGCVVVVVTRALDDPMFLSTGSATGNLVVVVVGRAVGRDDHRKKDPECSEHVNDPSRKKSSVTKHRRGVVAFSIHWNLQAAAGRSVDPSSVDDSESGRVMTNWVWLPSRA